MEPIFVYPGSFCPPTYGHVKIVKKAAKIFPHIYVVCSTNEDKEDKRFSEEECMEMWGTYRLPENVTITTFSGFPRKYVPEQIVMIRGIRNEEDLDDEKQVLLFNRDKMGIDKYFYICTDCDFEQVSSTRARACARELNLGEISNYFSPQIISRLLEKVLEIKNLFMVVGPPGSGKSTLLEKTVEIYPEDVHVNTDEYFKGELRKILEAHFSGRDLSEVAINDQEALKKLVREPWLRLMKKNLLDARGKRNIYVEIPYGLMQDKRSYRHLGGKVIYVGCEKDIGKDRILGRGTPDHLSFLELIPGKEETEKITKNKMLKVIYLDTNCMKGKMNELAINLPTTIEKDD